MSDDDEWDCDFIGGAAKAAARQMDVYKANNRDKKAIPKKAIQSEKSLDDSSFTVSPIKRRQSTEPLKQNTSQNVIRYYQEPTEESSDDDVYCTANDTFEKENQEDGEDEDGGDEIHRNSTTCLPRPTASTKGARGRSTRASKPAGNGSNKKKNGKEVMVVMAGGAIIHRKGGRRSQSSKRGATTSENPDEERARKTEEAFSRLTEARARAAASGEDDSSESDIEIVGVEKSLNSSRRLSMDDMIEVKIKWKWEVIRIQINKTSKLGVMFDRFGSKVGIDGDDIEYVLDGRVLKRSDTCQEVGITITSFVHASKVNRRQAAPLETEAIEEVNNDGLIELKIQCADRRSVQMMKVKPNSPFEIMMKEYAAKMSTKLDAIRFVFDGEALNRLDTPEDLDLEGGECIDAHIAIPAAAATNKSGRGSKKTPTRGKGKGAGKNMPAF